MPATQSKDIFIRPVDLNRSDFMPDFTVISPEQFSLKKELVAQYPDIASIVHQPDIIISDLGPRISVNESKKLRNESWVRQLSIVDAGHGDVIIKHINHNHLTSQVDKISHNARSAFFGMIREHHNLVRLNGVIKTSQSLGFVLIEDGQSSSLGLMMTKLPGRDLSDLVIHQGSQIPRFPIPIIRSILSQVTSELVAIEQAGMINVDLKLGNVLADSESIGSIDPLAAIPSISLIDFAEMTTTEDPRLWGVSEGISPPELLSIQAENRVDNHIPSETVPTIHTYELAKLISLMLGIGPTKDMIKANRNYDPALAELLLRATDLDPTKRFVDTRQFATAISYFLDEKTIKYPTHQ